MIGSFLFQYNKLEYMERKNQVEEALRKNNKRFVNFFVPVNSFPCKRRLLSFGEKWMKARINSKHAG